MGGDTVDPAEQKAQLNDQLKEYISEWKLQRQKEEEELQKLKEKQAKRKEIRAEQEKKLNQQKKEEEEKLRKEEAEKKAKEAEEKKKRLEEAEAKRQQMLDAQKSGKGGKVGVEVSDARKELSKTKEQLEEEKKIALSIRIKPLDLEPLDSDELKGKAEELYKLIIQLETDKYDYQQRKVTQELDLKELKERQKAQLRQKALKKGLDPDAFCGKYPPMIRMYSKYERRTDTRSYEDRKKLYEGGWEVIRSEALDIVWKDKHDEWTKRPSRRLPKWFGERPGKKKGDPESNGDDDEAGEDPPVAIEEDYEEEEDEEDYDEEEE